MNIPHRKRLGVTVLPEFFQNEGIENVLDRLTAVGVTAVATSPYVMEPADEKTGGREPPDDAGAGTVRLLDRPLWGRRELFVRTAPSFEPDARLYRGLRYQPSAANELTRREGGMVGEFLRAAQARHVQVYLQVQAAIPPGYRVQFGGPIGDDMPLLPDGRTPPRRLAKNGSLASRHVLDYTQALLRDLCRVYPHVDGFRIDWPEYPPYFLDDAFLDFSAPARQAAQRLGFNADRMQRDALAAYEYVHGRVANADLEMLTAADGGRHRLLHLLRSSPGLTDLLAFRAALAEELLIGVRRTLTAAAGERVELAPNSFAPPFTILSGFDFSRAKRHCQSASVKLYTMHWPMMVKFWGDALKQANPALDERTLVQALVKLFDLADDDGRGTLAAYAYPEPDQPHPVSDLAQQRKLRQAQQEAGAMPIHALVHGYGPPEDFRRRLRIAWQTSAHGVWINRYAYLSDAKLAIVGQECRAA